MVTRLICLLTALVVLPLEMTSAASADEGLAALDSLQATLLEQGIDVSDEANLMSAQLSESDSDTVETISAALVDMNTALPSLTEHNQALLVTSSLDLCSTFLNVVPVVGGTASTFFSIASQIYGIFAESPADVYKNIVDEAFAEYDEVDMRAKAQGVTDEFITMFEGLKPYLSAKTVTTDDMNHLEVTTRLLLGVSFQGEVATKALYYASREGQHYRAMAFIDMYAQLTVLQDLTRWALYAVAEKAGTAQSQIRASIEAGFGIDERRLEFLTRPTLDKAAFFSANNWMAGRYTLLRSLMAERGLHFQNLLNLQNRPLTLSPKEWPDWYMTAMKYEIPVGKVGSRIEYPCEGSTTVDDKSTFRFTIARRDNVFKIKSVMWQRYLTLDNGQLFFEPAKNNYSFMKVVLLDTGYYLISPVPTPDEFLYMYSQSPGTVYTYPQDPEDAGYWTITDA